MIPQANPRASYLAHRAAIDEAVARVLEKGRYVLGDECASFERELGEWLGDGAQAVGVASGTDALTLALLAVGVSPRDEVVTVSHTAVATVAAIERAGATPVLVDVDATTLTLDPAALEAALGPKTRAIVPVHLYGRPADLGAITRIAERRGIPIVEDCAQAAGARIDGRAVGTFGSAAAFSFYPTKNLGALGDGGAVVSRDSASIARARSLREYGWRERYVSEVAGFNSRLDELQAAILRIKLRALRAENERRSVVAARFQAALAKSSDPRPPAEVPANVVHAWHLFVVRSAGRAALQARLAGRGVGTLVHYPMPVHLQPAYRRLAVRPLPESERAAAEVLSLPLWPEMTESQVDQVCDALRAG